MKGLLLSGGMDSIALAYWLRPDVAFTIDYGQAAAAAELAASAQICRELSIRHEIVAADCRSLGSGDMAGTPPLEAAPVSEWWPFRNQLLITLAGMRAVSMGVTELMIGTVASDDAHADGRPDFVAAMDGVMAVQEGGVRVVAPAIAMTTVELVRASGIPGPMLAWAHSCHVGPAACGGCRGCVKHYEVSGALTGVAY